jgi:esterase/lipase superfamily enzyme
LTGKSDTVAEIETIGPSRSLPQNRTMKAGFFVAVVMLEMGSFAHCDIVYAAAIDEQGFRVHEIRSQFQTGTTRVRVLTPERLDAGSCYKSIYVLPVEAGSGTHWGDGLLEIKKHDLHNQHQVIFVAPEFSHLPWYADHPTDRAIRQESYLLQDVVPMIEGSYPIEAGRSGRLLLGFSKSGWGAWSLLLRHPELFARAAAWDAPLDMDHPGPYGSGAIFGTPENFKRYQVRELLRQKAASLGDKKRLILTGYDSFGEDHRRIHALLDELRIPHEFRDGPQRKHDWHSGWVPEAVQLLTQNCQ